MKMVVAKITTTTYLVFSNDAPLVIVRPKVLATASLMGCSEIEYKNELSDMVNKST